MPQGATLPWLSLAVCYMWITFLALDGAHASLMTQIQNAAVFPLDLATWKKRLKRKNLITIPPLSVLMTTNVCGSFLKKKGDGYRAII